MHIVIYVSVEIKLMFSISLSFLQNAALMNEVLHLVA